MWKRALVSSTGAIVALRLYNSSQAKSNELELKYVVCIGKFKLALGFFISIFSATWGANGLGLDAKR